MQADPIFAVFQGLILIFSIVIHEVSHGYMAESLGDPTARYAGRLTLNPLKHIDPFGSIVVPLLTYFTGGMIFGWAKPVPYNPYNLRNGRKGEAMVAFAGPLSNLAIAAFFSIILRLNGAFFSLSDKPLALIAIVVLINIVLAVFNLVPIPPLDGSRILFFFLPARFENVRRFLERYSIFLVLFLVFFLWSYISVAVAFLFHIATGIYF
jgi:Zn-dependent protease